MVMKFRGVKHFVTLLGAMLVGSLIVSWPFASPARGDHCEAPFVAAQSDCNDVALERAADCAQLPEEPIEIPFYTIGCSQAVSMMYRNCVDDARDELQSCKQWEAGRHVLGSIYHNIYRTVDIGATDQHHAWVSHVGPQSHGFKYAAVWFCLGNPSCWSTVEFGCDAWSDGVPHVHCDAWRDDFAHGYHETYTEAGGSDCGLPFGLSGNDVAWGRYADGHGICNHKMFETNAPGD